MINISLPTVPVSWSHSSDCGDICEIGNGITVPSVGSDVETYNGPAARTSPEGQFRTGTITFSESMMYVTGDNRGNSVANRALYAAKGSDYRTSGIYGAWVDISEDTSRTAYSKSSETTLESGSRLAAAKYALIYHNLNRDDIELDGELDGGVAGLYLNKENGTTYQTGNITGGTTGVYNDGDARGFVNSGTLSGQYGIINTGTFTYVRNTGVMAPLLNYGTVTGSAGLNNSTLVMAGNSATVGGVASWNGEKDSKAGHGVTLAVGDADNAADLTTRVR